jgi:hypothetical protein
LVAVRDTLGRLHLQLLAMPSMVSGYEGVLGGTELDSELEQFCAQWHYGALEIGERITELMGRLVDAADQYRRIEDGLASAGRNHGAALSGSGVTVINGGGPGPTIPASPASGSGTTTVAPAAQGGSVITTSVNGAQRGSGSGTTVVEADEQRSVHVGVA